MSGHEIAPPVRFSGAVLAGGRSERFGSDKCDHRFQGTSLLDRALGALEPAHERWIVGGPERQRLGATWVPDEPPGRGALAGVRRALEVARFDWVAIVACDMPFVPAVLWARLLAAAGEARLVMAEGPAGLEPLAAVYHRDLMPWIDRAWADGRRSPRALLEPHGRVVGWDVLSADLHAKAFLNVNRPEDLT